MALPILPLEYEPRWFAVDSSFIRRIGWLPNISSGGTLFVELMDERTKRTLGQYAYYDVPRAVWHGFREAESKGKFYNSVLKGRGSGQRVG